MGLMRACSRVGSGCVANAPGSVMLSMLPSPSPIVPTSRRSWSVVVSGLPSRSLRVETVRESGSVWLIA
jgi:hypothetical protein